mgnify:CR=1 FL=1
MKKYICSFPNCIELLDEPGLCARHKKYERKPYQGAQNPNKELYNSARWKNLAKKIKERDGYRCQRCGSRNGLSVHHIKPPRGNEDLFFDENNLVTICMRCHRIITAREVNRR